jgi:hypothetical protein
MLRNAKKHSLLRYRVQVMPETILYMYFDCYRRLRPLVTFSLKRTGDLPYLTVYDHYAI